MKKTTSILMLLLLTSCAPAPQQTQFKPPATYDQEFVVYRASSGNDRYQHVLYGDAWYKDLKDGSHCSAHIGRCKTVVFDRETGEEVYVETSGSVVGDYNFSEPYDWADGYLMGAIYHEGGGHTVTKTGITSKAREELYTVIVDEQFAPPVHMLQVQKKRYFFEPAGDTLHIYQILDDAKIYTGKGFLQFANPDPTSRLSPPVTYTVDVTQLRLVDSVPLEGKFKPFGYSEKGFDFTTDLQSMREHLFDLTTEKVLPQP